MNLRNEAVIGAATEIVSLWWTGPYLAVKMRTVEEIINRHLAEADAEAEVTR